MFLVERSETQRKMKSKERRRLWLMDDGRVLRDTHSAANYLADVTSFKKLDKTLPAKYAIKGYRALSSIG